MLLGLELRMQSLDSEVEGLCLSRLVGPRLP